MVNSITNYIKPNNPILIKNGTDAKINVQCRLFFSFLEYVKPICLPYDDKFDEDYRKDEYGNNFEAHVSGWGATTQKGIDCNEIFVRY